MNGSEVSLALIAIIGTVITALFKLLKDNTRALANLAKSNDELVKETRKGNREAAERNGHLGEQNENITKLIVTHAKESQALVDSATAKVTDAIQNVKKQTVEHQVVKHEVVQDKEVV